MQFRNLFSPLALVAVLLAACAPQAIQSPAPAANTPQAATQAPESQAAQPQATETLAQTQAPAAVATSRGDKLEATDPATVALASGGIQLVEFFRFT